MQSLDSSLSLPGIGRSAASPWWERERLRYEGERLTFAGHFVDELAPEYGMPTQFIDLRRAVENVRRLDEAFGVSQQPHRVHFAVKANRNRALLEGLRADGICGIDCCSPGEAQLALDVGFSGDEVSFTGTALSDRDVATVGALPIRVNLDSISAIHKMGQRFPGRRIGIRVNPQLGVGGSEQLTYSGKRPTKFGIYADRFDEAMLLAASYGLIVDGVHMHVGSGWLAEGVSSLHAATDRLCGFAKRVPDIRYVNVGGGIGVVHQPRQRAVDLRHYAAGIVTRVREALGPDVEVCCEPGEYIVGDAGIGLAEVTMVEEKGGELFVGLNVGFNSNPQAAHYAFRHTVLPAVHASSGPVARVCTVVGNINEVIDVFARGASFRSIKEGDVVAILNAGAYSSSMASDHCLRERAVEVLLR
ncbi:MAG: diaminopimelate decarboxylase [Bradymonadia bacterium]|jgi:diaminopimelate decarboxylase